MIVELMCLRCVTDRNLDPPPPLMQPSDRLSCGFSHARFTSASRHLRMGPRFSTAAPAASLALATGSGPLLRTNAANSVASSRPNSIDLLTFRPKTQQRSQLLRFAAIPGPPGV